MRKILSILLVFSLCFGIVGAYTVFRILQSHARQEIKELIKQGISDNQLHKIVFLDNEKPDWVEKGKEFRYRGQMYDIVKQKYAEGKVVYYCVNDKEETQLFVNLDELVKEQMENGNNPYGNATKLLLKFLFQTYTAEKAYSFTELFFTSELFFHYFFTLTSVYPEAETPPPDLG